ncbi:MAG: hypothetical protein JXA81_12890 [Sedimentisphaerales bacterium]|nr:hypothetical protein [Sedimentisphaerales bacterium]
MTAIAIVLALFLFCIPLSQTCIPFFAKLGSRARQHAKQLSQLQRIDTALDLFKSEFNVFPPSGALDENGRPYCGAMKLVEAMIGQDLEGFHPDSAFRHDGADSKGMMLYPDANNLSHRAYLDNMNMRKRFYFPDRIPYRLKDLYNGVGPFDGNEYVLCDEFWQVTHTGTVEKIGMPILYYKADTSKTAHDINDPNNPENIYNYRDNHALLALGVPGKPEQKHPLFVNPKIFYKMTRDYQFAKTSKPQRADSFILLSAGRDGLYGTKDDIANFDIQWKPK